MSSARDALRPAYLVYGEDRARVQTWVRRLSTRLVEGGGLPPERYTAEDTGAHEVVEAAQAVALTGVRGIVVDSVDRWRKGDVAALVEYLAAPNPATCLLLAGEKAPGKDLLDAVAAVGVVEHAGPELSGSKAAQRRGRAAWLVEQASKEAQRLGKELSAGVARHLVERVSEERAGAVASALEVRTEVAKLVAYSGLDPIDVAMVDAVTPAHPEARSYELADAITEGDRERAYGLLQDMASGADPQNPTGVQAALSRHFRAVAEAQAAGPRPSPDEVTARTGLQGFPARKVADQAATLPDGAGVSALIRVAAGELDLRVNHLAQLGRSRDDGSRLMLEAITRDLLEICAPRRSATA
ncbi:MAG: DNA polymerase III subunit delta [Miltoncostaeaceae bacterium]